MGKVDKSIYAAYLRAWGPCFILPVCCIGGAVIERGLQVWRLCCSCSVSSLCFDAVHGVHFSQLAAAHMCTVRLEMPRQ